MTAPFFGTYNRLGVHIYASNRTVIRAALGVIADHHKRDPARREDRKTFYRYILEHHKDCRDLAAAFRL